MRTRLTLSQLPRLALLALGATAAALLLATPLARGQAAPGPISSPQGISTLGEGIVTITPDTARVTLGVEIRQPSLQGAQSEAAQVMDRVIQALRAAGIPDADIRTVSYSVNPLYEHRNDQTALRGYQVQNLVEVRTTNVGGLGALIDQVVASGATRVHGVRFEASDMGRLKEQARELAMQNARAKAEQLARSAGVAAGRPIYIEEADTGGVTPVRAELAAPAAADRAQTPVQPGETQVRTTVRVLWAIQ